MPHKNMGFYYVYILRNKRTNHLYKGYSSDLRNRLKNHKENGTTTTSNQEWSLVWFCCFPSKTKAIVFENYLKSGSGRAFINKRLLK